MPEPAAFAKGFRIRKGATISGWKITSYRIQHVQEKKYEKYRFPIVIHLTKVVGVGEHVGKLTVSAVRQYWGGGGKSNAKVIYSPYGNPYRCTISGIQVQSSGDKSFVEATGYAVRIHRNQAGELAATAPSRSMSITSPLANTRRFKPPLWLVAIRSDHIGKQHRGVWLDFDANVYTYHTTNSNTLDFEKDLQLLSIRKEKVYPETWAVIIDRVVTLFQSNRRNPLSKQREKETTVSSSSTSTSATSTTTATTTTTTTTMAVGLNLLPQPIQLATRDIGASWSYDVSSSAAVDVVELMTRMFQHFFP